MIRVDARRLRAGLFAAAGTDRDKAGIVAEMLVEADPIGHGTHGTGLADGYLDALASVGLADPVLAQAASVPWRGVEVADAEAERRRPLRRAPDGRGRGPHRRRQ